MFPLLYSREGVGYFIVTKIHELTKVKFFAEFVGSLFIGLIGYAAVQTGLGSRTR